MKKNAIISITVLMYFIFMGCDSIHVNKIFKKVSIGTYHGKLQQNMSSLILKTKAADITVTYKNTATATITDTLMSYKKGSTSTHVANPYPPLISYNGSVVTLKSTVPSNQNYIEMINVVLPLSSKCSSLSIENYAGNITLQGSNSHLVKISVSTDAGNIEVNNSKDKYKRSIKLETDAGNISVSGVSKQSLVSAKTDAGNICYNGDASTIKTVTCLGKITIKKDYESLYAKSELGGVYYLGKKHKSPYSINGSHDFSPQVTLNTDMGNIECL